MCRFHKDVVSEAIIELPFLEDAFRSELVANGFLVSLEADALPVGPPASSMPTIPSGVAAVASGVPAAVASGGSSDAGAVGWIAPSVAAPPLVDHPAHARKRKQHDPNPAPAQVKADNAVAKLTLKLPVMATVVDDDDSPRVHEAEPAEKCGM